MDQDAPPIPDINNATTATVASAIDSDCTHDGNDCASASTQLQWDMQDAAGLAPTNVEIAKAQRAWERKPASPFLRRRLKVGKIMKRPGSGETNAPAGMYNVHVREPPSAVVVGEGTPMKAVKKMRVASDAMDRAVSMVSNWDRRGSPQNRRIVTRSSRGQEDLVALAEEEGDQEGGLGELDVTGLLAEDKLESEQEGDPEGTTVEIFDENGTKVDNTANDGDSDEWADESESASDHDMEAGAPEVTADTMLCAPFAPVDPSPTEEDFDDNTTEVDDQEEAARGWQMLREELHEERRKEAKSLGIPFDEYLRRYSPDSQPFKHESPGSQEDIPRLAGREGRSATANATERLSEVLSVTSTIPEGFVSPAASRRRPVSQVKMQNGSRRRTLPRDFAARYAAGRANSALTARDNMRDQHNSPQEEERMTLTPEQAYIMRQRQTTFGLPEDSVDEPEPPTTPGPTSTDFTGEGEVSIAVAKLSSPVPSIASSHPRMTPRRSPRRQSSSPFIRKSILKSSEKPHLVAFTPIKRLNSHAVRAPTSPLPFVPCGIRVEDSKTEQPARSSSAPPEELQISSRKQYQPRMSDDTALLEAFLKRASESKRGKPLSDTARRESFERQSESSVVPQALAGSPVDQLAPPANDILGDLDPNSPSPRKSSSSGNAIFHDEGPNIELEYTKDPIVDDEDELAAEATRPQKFSTSRKSGRTKKKPETLSASAYTGPAKISIKGSGDGVVLKQTEAQRLAVQTRKNTNSNKSGAVMPLVRLKTLREEAETRAGMSQELGSEAMDGENSAGRRGITWSETLVSFYHGEEPEVSMMMDDPSFEPCSTQNDATARAETGTVIVAPTADEIPGKQKLRRLKPPRTASTPVKPAHPSGQSLRKGDLEAEVIADKDEKLKPKVSVKSKVSRIATPAKPKRAPTPHVEDTDDITMANDQTLQLSAPSLPPPPATKQRSATVKRSAPAPTPRTKPPSSRRLAPTTTVPMAGKENSLIASPPKKRTIKTAAHAAVAPVRLGYAGETKSLAPAPRFDIQTAAKNRPNDEGAMAGLISSPPKKATRLMPGREVARGIVLGVGIGLDDEDIHHGEVSMRSPAKKRSARRFAS